MTQVKLLYIADWIIDIDNYNETELQELREELEWAVNDIDIEISRRRGGE